MISPAKRRICALVSASAVAAVGGIVQMPSPLARAAPTPEVEYLYDINVRRHYNFPIDTDALGYGRQICDKAARGDSYARLIGDAKGDITPNDESAANYLVWNAVGLLCPAQIWDLRNSAAHYRPPPA